MFIVNVIIDNDVIEATREAIRTAPGRFSQRVRDNVLPKVQQLVIANLGKSPGTVRYPFVFSTDKSRRAYFATKGFGRGIPYKRTGELGRAWTVRLDLRRNDGLLQIINPADAAGYVYGSGTTLGNFRQVPGHRNTGWGATLDDDLLDIAEQTNGWLIDEWFAVTTEAGK